MLGELHIRDLGVIDDARLEVSPGLNVLTGETGAGKTIVVDALTLLLGDRADPGAVRAGRPAAMVEVVRPLVEVHGQYELQRLLRPAVQRELLDRFAGDKVLALREEFTVGWRRLRAVVRELDELASRARERAREADLLRYQVDEIEAASVRAGELAELDAEAERLANAEALRDAAVLAWQLVEGDQDAGASTALGAAARAMAGPGRHDRALGELAARAEGLAAEVTDLASSLRAYAEGAL